LPFSSKIVNFGKKDKKDYSMKEAQFLEGVKYVSQISTKLRLAENEARIR